MSRARESWKESDTQVSVKFPHGSDTRGHGEREKTKKVPEGWIPVIRNHGGQGAPRNGITFTLFVDNILDQKDLSWLKKMFRNFGEVKDVFIPRKRSMRTGKKIGFIRYERQGDAIVAVEKMNGVWVENDRLYVKAACFGQKEMKSGAKKTITTTQNICEKGVAGKQRTVEVRDKCYGIGKSYAETLRGESSKGGHEHKFKLFVKPSGNG